MTATPVFTIDPESLLFDGVESKALGARLHDAYVSAEPYPYVVIDGALPESIVDRVAAEVALVSEASQSFSGSHENLKSQTIPERLPFYTRNLMYAFNSRYFLGFLEEITGIKNLIPDPYFVGGGLHETKNGGYLDIHADFNQHNVMNLERRINVLLYLNRNWKEEYGGSFEIWDTKMTKKHRSLSPEYNRMVIFTTRSDTMHGNPEPVKHPDGESRRSIAFYYYTATWDDARRAHSTIFRGRPGTDDASGLKDRIDRVIDDVLPPIVNRQIKKVRRRIGI